MASRNAGGAAPAAMFRLRPPPPMFPYPMPHGVAVPFVAPPPRFPMPHRAAAPYYGGAAAVRPPPPPATLSVEMRSVTAANFEAELDLIGSLLPMFSILVVDTEYPGAVHRPAAGRREGQLTADERYALVKANVDELPLVQLGLTLCDGRGNLPRAPGPDPLTGRPVELAWEFNFSDFDMAADRHVPSSVAFLQSQGIDFHLARTCGVAAAAFREKLLSVLPDAHRDQLTWAAFGGAYDFAYLVKTLGGGQPLPETREEFLYQVREMLGGRVFDAKYLAESCGRGDLRGVGLRGVATNLGVPRHTPEPPCLAGPKSLTACRILTSIRRQGLYPDGGACHEGVIDGLQ
ncbi:hypothetical protein PR202_ga07276 [Eleusine coracana subsp. coracana]|uniref:poly(A)-specific ribonuclease n=1 Tax=Eleusine coracana subsp. coracana TaxID=191504 RepID=A0AAV5BYW6_ELECO|nr:hypothetical protein QOZ80_2AG0110230 [Eleusine coracana subsp. coracana]GJM90949.1 hypothetical protein PR202_ga07276 [Eleusine coracana subsp. coracana]